MASNSTSSQVVCINEMSIDDFMPLCSPPDSFAAFCGDFDQRITVGEQGLCRHLQWLCRHLGHGGGVVVLHNDLQAEARLDDIVRALAPQGRILYAPTSSGLDYDPLYGLPQELALDAIVPMTNEGYDRECTAVRARLAEYLGILDHMLLDGRSASGASAGIMGEYPYNLDLLLGITGMPYERLEREVLAHLPTTMRDRLIASLSQDGAQQQAYDAVASFASGLEGRIWRARPMDQHTRTSIVAHVTAGNVVSLYLPSAIAPILDYLNLAISALIGYKTPFLLLAYDMDLTRTELRNQFLVPHQRLPHTTGLIASSAGMLADGGELRQLFRELNRTIVFSCGTPAAAEPFSVAFGEYNQVHVGMTQSVMRRPSGLSAGRSTGIQMQRSNQRCVPAEELAMLGNGALVFGGAFSPPRMVTYFDTSQHLRRA